MEKVIYLRAAKSAFPAFPILAACSAATASIAITHRASITPSTMPAAKNASKKKDAKEGLAVKKTVKTKAAPKPKKEKKPKTPKPKAAPKKKVNLLFVFFLKIDQFFFFFSQNLTNFSRLQQQNKLDLNTL